MLLIGRSHMAEWDVKHLHPDAIGRNVLGGIGKLYGLTLGHISENKLLAIIVEPLPVTFSQTRDELVVVFVVLYCIRYDVLIARIDLWL